ncbi:MAG: hypothetical protein IPP94_14585 [Ignavibacteria bacterium]|nr:hypothetical protein [Ignavibacteria bacterium]
MKLLLQLLSVAVLLVQSADGQPAAYRPRGSRNYLVNYGAIGGDRFLARFAARRFVLVDEGQRTDIALLHAANPALPILYYKDVVALHRGFPEYAAVNLDEHAFLHSADPAALAMDMHGDTASLFWLPDRRWSDSAGYRIYGSLDSAGAGTRLTPAALAQTAVSIRIPKSVLWLRVVTVLKDGMELNYGLPVRVAPIPKGEPSLALRSIAASGGAGGDLRVDVACASIGDGIPDSVVLFCDANRDNALDMQRERTALGFAQGQWSGSASFAVPAESKGGFEFALYAFLKEKRIRIPAIGAFGTNVNNRVMNDDYGFYVMDVGSSTWRQAYIGQTLETFASTGYNGLFEDDTWYRVEPWGVDVFPSIGYGHATWRTDMYAFLDSIKLAIAPRPAYFNGLYAGAADSLLLHADGGMTEGFAYTHWSKHVTGAYWNTLCDVGLRCMHAFRRTWLALGGAPFDDTEGRLYTLASYLLVQDSLGMYANATDYQEFSHFPEFDLPLGSPVDPVLNTVDELKRLDANGVPYYARRYQNGTVAVNPDPAKTALFDSLEWNGRPSVIAIGGITTDSGRVETVLRGRNIPPKSARIFLNVPPGGVLASPVFEAVEVTPSPAPSDGATPVRIRARLRDDAHAMFRSDSTLPLHVTADLGHLGGPKELRLVNDGSFRAGVASWYEGSFTIPFGAPPQGIDAPITACSTTGLVSVAQARVLTRSQDSANLLLNFSYEIDDNEDGIPDAWRPYVKGFAYDTSGAEAKTGLRSVHVRNDSTTDARGVYCTVTLNQTVAKDLELSGWSKAVAVSGAKNNDYALYCDVRYMDDTPLYGQCAQFTPGTHDWEYSSKIIRAAKPIRLLSLYALCRNRTGEAWFDQIALREYTDPNGVERTEEPASILCDVYPNPIRGSGTLTFTLRRASYVRITLHDALGRSAGDPIEGAYEAGTHRIALPATPPSSGVTFLRIEADGELIAKRVLSLR